MKSMLIPFQEHRNEILAKFIEALNEKDIRYYLSDYFSNQELNSGMINDAIKRATNACHASGIPVHKHFKKIYRFRNESISVDWRLSRLGFYLAMINANPLNPKVAALQTSLYNYFIGL